MKRETVVCATGGTGGHLYPLIGVAQSLGKKYRCSFFVSQGRQDEVIIRRYGFDYLSLSVSSFFGFLNSFFTVFSFLRRADVCAVLVSGGLATVPVILMARVLRLPILMLEQNVLPGRANRVMQFFVDKVCVSFEESLSYFSKPKGLVTGNPVRQIYPVDDTYRRLLDYTWPDLPVLLVFGGSQGASFLTQFCLENQTLFFEQNIIVWVIAGPSYGVADDSGIDCYEYKGEPRMAFFQYSESMDLLYQKATVVLSRSGATTVAELLAFQKPAVLVPYPYAKDDHQWFNAQALVRSGQAYCVRQTDCSFEWFLEAFFSLKDFDSSHEPLCRSGQLVINAFEALK